MWKYVFCYIQQKYVQEGLYNRPNLPVGTINFMVVSFTPLPLYLPVLSGRRLCGLLFHFANLGREKCLLPLLDIDHSSLSFPASSILTIPTQLPVLPLAPRTQLIQWNRPYLQLNAISVCHWSHFTARGHLLLLSNYIKLYLTNA